MGDSAGPQPVQPGSRQLSSLGHAFAGSGALSCASGTLSEAASSGFLAIGDPRHTFAFPDEIFVEGEEAHPAPQAHTAGEGTVEQHTAAVRAGQEKSSMQRCVAGVLQLWFCCRSIHACRFLSFGARGILSTHMGLSSAVP